MPLMCYARDGNRSFGHSSVRYWFVSSHITCTRSRWWNLREDGRAVLKKRGKLSEPGECIAVYLKIHVNACALNAEVK